MTTPKEAGMIGLGIMGTAMSRNLLAAGFSVAGYDVDKSALARFETDGGQPSDSPGDVASAAGSEQEDVGRLAGDVEAIDLVVGFDDVGVGAFADRQ